MSRDDYFPEWNEMQNQLYAVIFPILAKHETRGFNAHQRAQSIVVSATADAEDWILRQRGNDAESKDPKAIT